MPLYTRFEQVRLRVIGKIRFAPEGEEEENENLMPISLAKRLMNEAEGQVEQDLSPRYFAPFQTPEGQPFSQLPIRPTQEVIATLCELQSVIRLLETDFGRGSVVNADKYSEALRVRYDAIIKNRILARKAESYQNWAFPPLPGMRLQPFNSTCDDGYSGTPMVVQPSGNSASFPSQRMNDPRDTYWNIGWDDIDGCV
jgi:hypothetical protein